MILGVCCSSVCVVLCVFFISYWLVVRLVKCSMVLFDCFVFRNLFGLWILRLCCVILKLLVVLCMVVRCCLVVLLRGFWYSSRYMLVVEFCFMCLCNWCSCDRLKCLVCLIIISEVLGMFILILMMVVVISRWIVFWLKFFMMICFFIGFMWLCIRLICRFGRVVERVVWVLVVVCNCKVLDFLMSG